MNQLHFREVVGLDSLTGTAGMSVEVGRPGVDGLGNREIQTIKVKKSFLPSKTAK